MVSDVKGSPLQEGSENSLKRRLRRYLTRDLFYAGLLAFVLLAGLSIAGIPPLRHRLTSRVFTLRAALVGEKKPLSAQVGQNPEPLPPEFSGRLLPRRALYNCPRCNGYLRPTKALPLRPPAPIARSALLVFCILPGKWPEAKLLKRTTVRRRTQKRHNPQPKVRQDPSSNIRKGKWSSKLMICC